MARKARISAIKYGGSREQSDHAAASLREACALVDKAALDEPDLIALPEAFTFLGWEGAPVCGKRRGYGRPDHHCLIGEGAPVPRVHRVPHGIA